MPLFHFNSLTGEELLLDPEGEELANLDEARQVALRSAREALVEAIKSHDRPPDLIQVTDNTGSEIMTVRLTEILTYKD